MAASYSAFSRATSSAAETTSDTLPMPWPLPQISFHAFGLEFLRKNHERFGLRPGFGVADKMAKANPLFKEIIDSQRVFAARAVKWDMDTNTNRRMAYNHYFGAKTKKA